MKKAITLVILLALMTVSQSGYSQTRAFGRVYEMMSIASPNIIFLSDSTILVRGNSLRYGRVNAPDISVGATVSSDGLLFLSRNGDSLRSISLGRRADDRDNQVIVGDGNFVVIQQSGPEFFRKTPRFVKMSNQGVVLDTGRIPYDSTRMVYPTFASACQYRNRHWYIYSAFTMLGTVYSATLILNDSLNRIVSYRQIPLGNFISFYASHEMLSNGRVRMMYQQDGLPTYIETDSIGNLAAGPFQINMPLRAPVDYISVKDAPNGDGVYCFVSVEIRGTHIIRYNRNRQEMWRVYDSVQCRRPIVYMDGGFGFPGARAFSGMTFMVMYNNRLQRVFSEQMYSGHYSNGVTSPAAVDAAVFDQQGNGYIIGSTYSLRDFRRMATALIKYNGFPREFTPWVPVSTSAPQSGGQAYVPSPNPSQGQFYLHGQDVSSSTEVRLYDMQGRLVLTQQVTGHTTLSTQSLSPGLYRYTLHPLTGQTLTQRAGKILVE